MEIMSLAPDKVLVPGHWVNSPEKLSEYHKAIFDGDTDSILPVTVMRPDQYSVEEHEECWRRNEIGLSESCLERGFYNLARFKRNIESWLNHGAEYLLCDGNHRSMAFFLNDLPFPARQIQNSKDLSKINKEFAVRESKGPEIMRESNSLEEYFFKLYWALSNERSLHTLEGKTNTLLSSGDLKIEGEKIIYEPNLPF